MRFVDCQILRCHAQEHSGGFMVRGNNYPIMLEMLRGTITGCSSAQSGGGISAADKSHVVLVDVQIDACQATGEKNA